ncbi:MAG TPA: septum formation family protein [Micromonosporaceae bacterium]|nr:septum formation family protein [Micromonosporaceae bacterium]
MRRWLSTVALCGVAAMVLTGCGNPAGVDGNLTDDWAAIGEPEQFIPAADTCHPRFNQVGYLSSYQPVDCDQEHEVETVHLGTFTGDAAGRTSLPAAGSPDRRAAWNECHTKANEILGADWRTARLSLALVLPSPAAWTGGARWFRCDLGEVKSLDDQDTVSRTGSLKGALTGSSPLSYGCFNPKFSKGDEYVDEMVAIACNKPHHSEFVGIYTAPDTTYQAFSKDNDSIHRGCLGVVASYAKLPNNSDMKYRTGTIYYTPNEDEWKLGDRGVKCFLWRSDRKLTRSVKGAGSKTLPVS